VPPNYALVADLKNSERFRTAENNQTQLPCLAWFSKPGKETIVAAGTYAEARFSAGVSIFKKTFTRG
jgi:hypothetical protein